MNDMANEPVALVLSLLAGLVLGAVFFAGLWWTARKCISSGQPAFWMFGSLLLRMSVALAGFYFASSGDWKRLVACLVGFMMARLIVTWLTRSPVKNQLRQVQEPSHAP